MSGGVAYVYELEESYCNTELVHLKSVQDEDEITALKTLITRHVEYTGSDAGRRILENWDNKVVKFTKVIPVAYEEMISLIEKAKADGHSDTEAHLIAFYMKHGKNA